MHSSSFKTSAPGFLGYLAIALWFLLTIMAPGKADAGEPARQTPAAQIIITPGDILPEIEAALAERGLAANAEITFADPNQRFAIQRGAAPIDNVSYSPRSGRFVIRLAPPAGAAPVSITGFARAEVSFPVLTRPIARGEIITEDDIAYIETAVSHPGAFVHDANALIGMEARRPLRAQAPLRASDIAAPVLINKGAVITLTYAIEGMRLSHQGVALSGGGKGEIISVRNIQSDRVLKAVIEDVNLVRIAAPRARMANRKG